jgi:hypothetical protein
MAIARVDRTYRFRGGESAVEIVVHDRNGQSVLGRPDELDIVGDMLRFVRAVLSDSHPQDYL